MTYYVFVFIALCFMAVGAANRVRNSALGSSTELTMATIVVGGGLLATIVGMSLWGLPNARCRTLLSRRFPNAVVLTARGNDFRAFIDVDALKTSYRSIPYFLTVVADPQGISAWMGGDPGERTRLLAEIPWSAIGELEQSVSGWHFPQYVVTSAVTWRGEDRRLQLTLGSGSFGGLFPQTYGSSQRSVAALEAVRSGLGN
ncbi:hypothetical protein [Leifsonia poae]|uniref:hypothetical protein n=1 Tax=Leifsonia poae TaxID=110933 RepID=UPI003D66EA65